MSETNARMLTQLPTGRTTNIGAKEPLCARADSTRVLLWSPKGAGLHYGGPGMTAFRMYKASSAHGISVSLSHGFREQAEYELFELQKLIHPLGRPGSILPFLLKAQDWLKQSHTAFDVFHGLQGFHATVLPAFWAQKLGLPAVVKLAAHRSDLAPHAGAKSLLRLPEHRQSMLKTVSAVIALSKPIVEELLEYGFPESKIVHIPNAVRTDEFSPAASTLEKSQIRADLQLEDRPTVLFAGVVNQRKRPHLLVEALEHLPTDTQLVIVGPQETEPSYVESLKAKLDALGLEERVALRGFTSQLAPYYRAADVFALPSSKEGMPNALLEAMASGLPSVVTDFHGSEDILGGTTAGLIAQPTPAHIADALSHFLGSEHETAAAGQTARTIAESRYSVDAVFRKHMELFDRIRQGKAPRQ